MNLWLQFILGACAVIVTVSKILVDVGVWGGHVDSGLASVRRHEDEINRLRDWRHKIGEDPNHSVLQLYRILAEDVKELERELKEDIRSLEAKK